MKALIIDDEYSVRLALGHFLRGRDYEVLEAATGGEGLVLAKTSLPDIVFLDQRLPDMAGNELLRPLTAPEVGARVVIMTAYVEIDKAVQAMKNGAEYFFAKPFDLEQVAVILDRLEEKLRLENVVEHYRKLGDLRGDEDLIIGESSQIIKIQRLISLLAQNKTTPVLILGESGTGKELVARAIHTQSGLTGPLVEINCASLTENFLESELFGHEKGAFTDAKEKKLGLFELAYNGSIFFDEVTEMPLSIQAKLLKVLDLKKFRRLGGVNDIKSNARVTAAANRDIVALVRRGQFREDLYYRVNVLPITVPPLRERGKDIVLMADYFARKIGERMGKGRIRISTEALGHLQNYYWPGNVRELKNVIERALILAPGSEILLAHLPAEIRQNPVMTDNEPNKAKLRSLLEVEDDYISYVLGITGNNHSRSAAILGISRSTLLARLKKHLP